VGFVVGYLGPDLGDDSTLARTSTHKHTLARTGIH
jgi:hypothetical protein